MGKEVMILILLFFYFLFELPGSKFNIDAHVLAFQSPFCTVHQKIGETVGEVRAVAGMHQRKAEMARLSDCFIALPGSSPASLNIYLCIYNLHFTYNKIYTHVFMVLVSAD